MSAPHTTFEPRRKERCRSCGAEIVWLKTVNGKNIPVDAETVADGDTVFDPKRRTIFDFVGHVTHFETCPDRDKWRRK